MTLLSRHLHWHLMRMLVRMMRVTRRWPIVPHHRRWRSVVRVRRAVVRRAVVAPLPEVIQRLRCFEWWPLGNSRDLVHNHVMGP
jgi:hypothetical protein